MMTSELMRDPGMSPPHVAEDEKSPDATAVKMVAWDAEKVKAADAVTISLRKIDFMFVIDSCFSVFNFQELAQKPIHAGVKAVA